MRRLAIAFALALIGSAAAPMVISNAGADPPANSDWKQFRYDQTHTGFNPAETTISASNAASLTLAWVKGPGTVDPLVEHGKVVTCGSAFCDSRLLTNGQQIWQSGPRAHAVFDTIGDGRLFTVFHMVLRVTERDLATGADVAGFGFPGGVTPVVYHNGRVFYSAPRHIFARDLNSDAVWQSVKAFVAFHDGYGFPTVAYNRVYATGCRSLYELKEDNLRYRWSVPLYGDFDQFGCQGGLPVADDHRIIVANNALTAYDYLTGATLWTVPGDGGQLGAPAVAYGLIYAVSADAATISAYSAETGARVWSTPTDASTGVPTVANGLVYLPSPSGLQIYDASTGTLVTTIAGTYYNEAVVSNGSVVVQCPDSVCVLRPA